MSRSYKKVWASSNNYRDGKKLANRKIRRKPILDRNGEETVMYGKGNTYRKLVERWSYISDYSTSYSYRRNILDLPEWLSKDYEKETFYCTRKLIKPARWKDKDGNFHPDNVLDWDWSTYLSRGWKHYPAEYGEIEEVHSYKETNKSKKDLYYRAWMK